MKVIFSVIFAFGFGVFASDFFISSYRMFSADQLIKCLPDKELCVGDKYYIVCEDMNTAIIDEETLFVDAIIKGERCAGEIEGFGFRNSTTATDVSVVHGEVTEIRRGALHAFDL